MMTQAPFFIVGCPRSGTTLVSQLLDGHSRIAVFVESLYYTLFSDIRRYYGDLSEPGNTRRLCGDLLEMIQLRDLDRKGLPSTDELVAGLGTASFAGILSTFLLLYARNNGKVRAGEKTARHYEFLPKILNEFPDSPIVFVMRDPRDVMVSAHKMFNVDVHQVISWWNRAFEGYRQLEEHEQPAYLMQYEKLVLDPQSSLEGLCAYLGERYEPEMLEFFARVPEKLSRLPHHSKLASAVTPKSVGKFAKLTDLQITTIEAACAEGMNAMGYAAVSINHGTPVHLPSRGKRQVIGKLKRLYRVLSRPDLRFLGWRRWKMRQRARIRYVLGIGLK